MLTSKRLLAGLVITTALTSTACTTVVPKPVAVTSPAADEACHYAAEDYAPQIMVYDSSTGTETHVEANGSQSTLAVRSAGSHRGASIVGADTSGRGPRGGYICSPAFGAVGVVPARANVTPVLIGATAGAVTGALITRNAQGAAEGAVIGGSLISNYNDPRKGEDMTVGAALGAAVGAAATKGSTSAAAGALTGAVLGHEVYDGSHGRHAGDRDDDD
jgi:hypothetical protein